MYNYKFLLHAQDQDKKKNINTFYQLFIYHCIGSKAILYNSFSCWIQELKTFIKDKLFSLTQYVVRKKIRSGE